jgi:LuxR family maltose regulon positive regulatory protein
MSGRLCDAVTGRDGSRATLEALDRANLFLVSLDDRREWYRYHHLFADVLLARLLDEQPDDVADLHRRASEWYEQSSEPGEAIRHAMAGKDVERAADLIELAMPAMRRDRQDAVLRQWLEWLPDDLIRARPVLSDGYAAALLVRGESAGVEGRLQDAERWLDPTNGDPVIVDRGAFGDLPGTLAIHRAGLARLLGDVGGTVRHARRALQLVRDDDHLGRGSASALLGLAHWTNADLDAAYRGYADAIASLEKAGYLSDVVACAITLADIRLAQGRLNAAVRLYERGLQVATGSGNKVLRGAADMHVGIAAILRERNDLDGARQHLDESTKLGEENGLPRNPYRSRVAMAQVRQAEGDLDGALKLLADADRVYFTDFAPSVRPVPALIARVWIAAGRLPEAWGWAREHGLSAADELSYVREFEHATLARLLLAEGARDRASDRMREAVELLERLLSAATNGGRTGSVIDILVAHALAHHAAGDPTTALASLERAIALAGPEGYVRIFVDEGEPMEALLKLAAKQRAVPREVPRLLAAFGAGSGGPIVQQALIEPLSDRELEVLRLLESELDGPDIARELVVSLNTVRTHTKNIYAKLGVNSRRAAVRRAAELGLQSRTRTRRPTA